MQNIMRTMMLDQPASNGQKEDGEGSRRRRGSAVTLAEF